MIFCRSEEYLAKGVRWAYHGERTGKQTKLSQDIEPENIVLSPDEKTAYVVLQVSPSTQSFVYKSSNCNIKKT